MREALLWAATQARECEEQAALEVFPASGLHIVATGHSSEEQRVRNIKMSLISTQHGPAVHMLMLF